MLQPSTIDGYRPAIADKLRFYCVNTSYPMDKRQKKTSCIEYRQDRSGVCIRQVVHHTSFLSRQRDVIASFSFGSWSVRTCFQRETFFLTSKQIHLLLFLLKYQPSFRPQDRNEAPLAMLWLVLMAT